MIIRVVYKPDKSVSIIYPAPNSRRENKTEAQWLIRVFEKIMSQGRLKGLPYDDIDSSEIPQTREDRDAWEGKKGKGITINQEKAKEIRDAREQEKKVQEKIREMAIKELAKEEDKS